MGSGFCQNVTEVESVLVKKRAGDYTITPPSPDPRTKPVPVPAPAQGSFTVGKGEELRTGSEDGTVLILDTAGSARMEKETAIKVPAESGNTHSLEQLEGALFFNIDAEELKRTHRSEFRLKTPAALLAVKGTHFFAQCAGGTDLIGVHEGVVMVHEPVSRETVTLTAGKAIEVQSGSMGEERSLTADELANQSLYASLELRSVPVPIVRATRGGSSGGALAMAWGDLLLRDATTPPGQEALQVRPSEVNTSGALRLAWPGLPPLKEPAVLWSEGQLQIPAGAASSAVKPVAVRASVRASGCSEVLLGIRQPDGSEAFQGATIRQTSWPANGQWLPCLLELPDGVDDLHLAIRAAPDVSQQMRTPGRMFNVGSIEIKDVRLLLGPKDEGVE
jgi:hypothetical protein